MNVVRIKTGKHTIHGISFMTQHTFKERHDSTKHIQTQKTLTYY